MGASLVTGAAAGASDAMRVLLVEQDPLTLALLGSVLEEEGMEVLSCASTEQALQELAQFDPDLMLVGLDVGSDGSELTLPVREQAEFAWLPIIFLSGEPDERRRFEVIASGADDFLLKPVSRQLLGAAIRSRVKRARMLPRTVRASSEPVRRGGSLRRGEFLAQLGSALRGDAGPWQVLIALRVDQSKLLGETLGQAGGFELEQAIAARFSEALNENDAYTLWMEFGFGILAERDSREEIEALARDLCLRTAQSPFTQQGEAFQLTVSVGVALAPVGIGEGDPDRWFASAYAAQAIAHRLGGNRFDGVLSRDHGSMPPERVLIIREWVKEAVSGENVLIEFQPILPLQTELAGLYSLEAKLRDFRAPLAGVQRKEYLSLAREAGALPMIDRMSLFSAFEAIEEERARGRSTKVLVSVDLATITEAQLRWLDAELRRRKAHSDGLIIEFDADVALGRPELAKVVQRLEDQSVMIAIADNSGNLLRVPQLLRFPASLLRLPVTAVDSVAPAEFIEMLAPWRSNGRGLIADHIETVEAVARLWELQVSYVQGDALAAGGPRLDYEFTQFGL